MAKEIKRETHELYKGKVIIDFLPDSHQYWLVKDGEVLPKKKRLTGSTSFTGQLDKSAPLIYWATKLYTSTVKVLMGENNTFTADDVKSMLEQGEIAHKEDKEKACGVGDYVHEFASEYSKDLDPVAAYDRAIINLGFPAENMIAQIHAGCKGFVEWLCKNKVKIISAEKIVYSRKFGFCGRYDATIEMDGKKYLADYKTGKSIYNEYRLQVSSYLKAYEEETNDKLEGALIIAIVKEDILDKDGNTKKKAGEVIVEIRNRDELVKDYKAFKALIDVKERLKQIDT